MKRYTKTKKRIESIRRQLYDLKVRNKELRADNILLSNSLKAIYLDESKQLEMTEIIKLVSLRTGIEINDILGKSRKSEILFARYFFIHLCSKFTTVAIAKFLKKNTSTIVIARQTIKKLIQTKEEQLIKFL